MSQQRPVDALLAALEGGVEGELLVRRDMGDEPAVQGAEAGHGHSADLTAVNLGRHLYYRRVVKERQGPAVAHIDDMPPGLVAEEAGHQLDGGLRIKSTTPSRKQLGLGAHRLV